MGSAMIPVSLGKRARIAQALDTLRKNIRGPSLITDSVDPEIYKIPRNLDIFPTALGSYQQSKQALELPLHYTLNQLKEYCKQTGDAKHEFLLLEVQDERIPQISNWVVLDRTVGVSTSGAFAAVSTSVSSGSPAQDRLRVSCYGKKDLLTKQCGLTPYEVLERVTLPTFASSTPLLLCELVILALETSRSRFMYNLMSAQCFWFASCVWECMLKLRPEAYRSSVAESNNRGRFGNFFRQDVDNLELDDILYKTKTEIELFRVELARGKEMHGRAKIHAGKKHLQHVRGENDELRTELKRLRDAAGQGAPARDAFVRDAPVRDLALRDLPAPVRDPPVQDLPMQDLPVRDPPMRVTPWGFTLG